MSTALQTQTTPMHDIEVLDGDTGKLVKRSAEQQRESFALHNTLQTLDIFKGLVLLKFQDEKRYLDFHCASMKEYCEQHAGTPYRTAVRHVVIAKRLKDIVPGIAAESHVPPVALGNPNGPTLAPDSEQEMTAIFGDFGVRKLDALLRYEDEELKELFAGGEITGPDGTSYTLDEIKEMSARQVTAKLTKQHSKEKKQLSDKLAEIKAENELLKSEKLALFKQNKELEEKAEQARMIEQKYGPKARAIKDKLGNLDNSLTHLREFMAILANTELQEDDPDEIVQRANDVHTTFQLFTNNVNRIMLPMLSAFESLPDPLAGADDLIAAAMAEQDAGK